MQNVAVKKNIGNVLWVVFGAISGIQYYSKSEYAICVIMSLITVFYTWRIWIESFSNNTEKD